jgi:hypothetical protein
MPNTQGPKVLVATIELMENGGIYVGVMEGLPTDLIACIAGAFLKYVEGLGVTEELIKKEMASMEKLAGKETRPVPMIIRPHGVG